MHSESNLVGKKGAGAAKTGQDITKRMFLAHFIQYTRLLHHTTTCAKAWRNTKLASPDFDSGPGCTGGQLHIRASRVQVAGSAPPKSPFCSGLLLHLLNYLLQAHKQGCYDASALHTGYSISHSLDELHLQLQSLCCAVAKPTPCSEQAVAAGFGICCRGEGQLM